MKIRKLKKVFTAATILGHVPEVMSLNAKNAQKMRSRRVVNGKIIRFINLKRPHDEEIRWASIAGWHIPYTWSTVDGCWYHSVDCLYWENSTSRFLVKSHNVPITFSSEHTASSPRHPGEE